MRWVWLLLSVATAQLIVSREVVTDVPAQKVLLRVRYALANDSPEPFHNVTIYDPSFNKTNVKFEDLRRRAKVTFGTIKPGEQPYFDLDMFPKEAGEMTLQPYTVQYRTHDMTPQEVTVGESDLLHIRTYRDHLMSHGGWTHAFYAVLSTIPVGIAPLALSCYLKHQRSLIYKNLKGQ